MCMELHICGLNIKFNTVKIFIEYFRVFQKQCLHYEQCNIKIIFRDKLEGYQFLNVCGLRQNKRAKIAHRKSFFLLGT